MCRDSPGSHRHSASVTLKLSPQEDGLFGENHIQFSCDEAGLYFTLSCSRHCLDRNRPSPPHPHATYYSLPLPLAAFAVQENPATKQKLGCAIKSEGGRTTYIAKEPLEGEPKQAVSTGC